MDEEADPSKIDRKMFPTKLSSVDPDLAKIYTKTGDDAIDRGNDDDEIGVSEKPKGVAKVADLSPSQSSMNIDKALAMVITMLNPERDDLQAGGDLGAFISEDGFIMDGHHRWIATAMIDPSLSVGGYLVHFPGEKLVAVLNAMTKGRYGEMKGKPASGGFEQFQEAPIRQKLEEFLKEGKWGNSPETVQAIIEKWTGQQGPAAVDAAVQKLVKNLSGLNLTTPSWAPERPDMPIIDKPDIPDAVTSLKTGIVDVNPPYSKATQGAFTKKYTQGAHPVKGGRPKLERKQRTKKTQKRRMRKK